MSMVHTDPDIAVELFMLEPVGDARGVQVEYHQELEPPGP